MYTKYQEPYRPSVKKSASLIKVLSICCIILLPAIPAHGQFIVLSGSVADAGAPSVPLPGATVIGSDSRAETGTSADLQGRFVLRIDTTTTRALEIRYIGYEASRIHLTSDMLQSGDLGTVYLKRDPVIFSDVIITTSPAGRAAAYQPARSYNHEQLQRMSSSSFGELLDGEPGVSMRSFGSAPARPVIRGLDGDRVLIVENGERMGDLAETAADHAITLDPLSADRIEVVRGPASLLYGSSALGGVINLFNSDIPDGWVNGISGSAALQGASVNNALAGFGRLLFGTGTGAFTTRINYRSSGDIRTPDERLPGTSNDHLSGSGGYTLRHGENSYTGFSFTGLGTTYGLPDALDNPEERIEIRMQRHSVRSRGTYHLNRFVNRADIRFNATWYNHKEVELQFVPGGTFEEDLGLAFTSRSANGTMLFHHGGARSPVSGTFGINTGYRQMKVGGNEALTPDMRSFILAGLLFEEFRLASAFSVQLGIRAEYQHLEALANNDFSAAALAPRSEWVASGSTGFNWRPTTNVEAGFQIARAYRLPRLEELYSDAPHLGAGAYEIGNPDLKNEIGIGTDLFFRYRDQRLFMEAAVFYNTIQNFVTYSPTGQIHEPGGLPVFIYDASHAELLGGEFDIVYRSRNMTFTGGFDYVRGSRIDSGREPLPFMPPLRGKFGISYEASTWFAGTSARVTGSQKRVADGEEETGGYVLLALDGGISMTDNERHTLTFRIDNALNTSYKDHLTRIEDRNRPMPGRGMTITYRYLF
jgi:iron complex outermembrane recepter protein